MRFLKIGACNGMRHVSISGYGTNSANENHHNMKSEILSPSVSAAHRSAGQMLATCYLSQLAITNAYGDAALKFPTLRGMAYTFRHELSQRVFSVAAGRGVRNIKVRHDEIVSDAHYAVKIALESDAALARRLVAIRDTQARATA